MKKLLLIVVGLFVSIVSMAQVPNLINYQAVVRDASGASIVSTSVGVQVSILVSSPTGLTAYSETHTPMTNQYGLMNFRIGEGTVTAGDFATIAWGSNDFYLQVEVDPLGGTAYTITSTSQLVAVPYALHAETAANVDDADADPANETITAYALNASNELEITEGGTVWTVDLSGLVDDADADPANETITSTSFAGSTLTIVEAGTTHDITITGLGDDADADPDNEAQTISLTGSTATLTDVGGVGGGSFSINDADADPDNEAQTLSLAGSTATLSDVGGVGGGSISINDADADPDNEAQTISLAGSTATLTDVGGVGGGSFSINDADADPDNEAQTISLAGSTVTLTDVGGTGGGSFSINDADADDSNELITDVSLSGTDLEITEDGTVHSVDLSGLATGGTRYYVGQRAFGGVIFFVDSTGEHGLVATKTPLAGLFIWDPTGGGTNALNPPPGPGNLYDATSDWDGKTNTTNAYTYWESTAYTEPTYAIKAAEEHVEGGFSDWFLPATWQLHLLIQNYYLFDQESAGLLLQDIWSSTENDGGGTNSMQSDLMSGSTYTFSQLDNARVWPIREF